MYVNAIIEVKLTWPDPNGSAITKLATRHCLLPYVPAPGTTLFFDIPGEFTEAAHSQTIQAYEIQPLPCGSISSVNYVADAHTLQVQLEPPIIRDAKQYEATRFLLESKLGFTISELAT